MSGTYLYVVTSDGSDYFAEMASISLASLRLNDPLAKIVTLVDQDSAKINSHGMKYLKNNSDELKTIQIQSNDTIQKSRILKVTCRKKIDGDFLFIDSDTFILKNLSEVWNFDCDMAFAPDLGKYGKPFYMDEDLSAKFSRLKWPEIKRTYLNCGVFYCKDNFRTQRYFDIAYESWLDFSKLIGKYNDQPAFNHAIEISDLKHKLLDISWNVQIVSTTLAARNGKIIHPGSAGFATRDDTVLHVAAKSLRETGAFDQSLLTQAIKDGHIWTELDKPKKSFAAKRYFRAAGQALRRIFA